MNWSIFKYIITYYDFIIIANDKYDLKSKITKVSQYDDKGFYRFDNSPIELKKEVEKRQKDNSNNIFIQQVIEKIQLLEDHRSHKLFEETKRRYVSTMLKMGRDPSLAFLS